MRNAMEYASEDSRALADTVRAAGALIESVNKLKERVDDTADGMYDISEDAYERALNTISISGISKRLIDMCDNVDDCLDALKNAQK